MKKEPYQRKHKRLKGQVAGTKRPSLNLGCRDIKDACNRYFIKHGLPVNAYTDMAFNYGRSTD